MPKLAFGKERNVMFATAGIGSWNWEDNVISNIITIQSLHSGLTFRPYKQVSQIKAKVLPHRFYLPSHFPEN